MSQSPVYIGVDVASDSLAVHGSGLKPLYPNSPQGFASLIKALPAAAHVVLEATGGYQLNFVLALHEQDRPVSVLNGRQVRDFAKAMGRLAKTDKVDAALIAEFAASKRPLADTPPTTSQLRLAELVCRRQQLVELRLSESNRLLHLRLPVVRAQFRRLLAMIERNITALEKLITQTIAADEHLATRCQRLRKVEGIGLIASATLLALMPELGSLSRSRAASLVGVAPFARDTAVMSMANAAFSADGRLCVMSFICPLSPPSSETAASSFFTTACDPQANLQNSPSRPSCVNSFAS